jgi:hypothetical protein
MGLSYCDIMVSCYDSRGIYIYIYIFPFPYVCAHFAVCCGGFVFIL